MDLFIKGLILGSVQGIFEWLPVSSEGITSLIEINIFRTGVSESISFAIWLHLGTLAAVIFHFREDIKKIIKTTPSFLKRFTPHLFLIKGAGVTKPETEEEKILSFLFFSTLFTGVSGIPLFWILFNFEKFFGKNTGLIFTFFIGIFLIITGLIQKYIPKKTLKTPKNLSLFDGVLLGILQGLAIIPGLSRSGLTISGLLARKFDDEYALKLSFLMSIPAIIGAQVLLLLTKEISFQPSLLIGGLIFSFLFGLLTIKILLKLAKTLPFWKFALFLGILTICIFLIIL